MQPVARIGDIGIGTCYCHKSPITVVGTIVAGSSTKFANNIGIARIGDMVICSCGHVTTIVMGSPSVFADNIPASRMGDLFIGCAIGNISVGSSSVMVA